MVDYTFTTAHGMVVTEYRPFSLGYAVMHTPCLDQFRFGDTSGKRKSYAESGGGVNGSNSGDDLLGALTKRKLKFESFSVDVLRQLLAERVAIRDRNRSSILEGLNGLSNEIGTASQSYAFDNHQRKHDLEKTRLDLEREFREGDERLWKDTLEIRQALVDKAARKEGTSLRYNLFNDVSPHDDKYKGQGHSGVSG